MPQPDIRYTSRRIEHQNADGSIIGIVGVDFSKCRKKDDALTRGIKRTLKLVLEQLHRDLDERGMFRYTVRSEHLQDGRPIAMQTEFFYAMDHDDMFERLCDLINSENTQKFFKDLILFEIIFTSREVNEEPNFED